MSVVVEHRIGLDAEECISCGVVFAWPSELRERRKSDHKTFWCPNGHGQHFTGKTDAEKLREQLTRERDALASLRAQQDQMEASLRSTRGVVTRQRKRLERVAKGVCPCCNRSFSDVHKHMQNKHPEWDGGVG